MGKLVTLSNLQEFKTKADSTYIKKTGVTGIDLGSFLNSIISITDASVLSMFENGGVFLFTYGNCYGFCTINATALASATTSPIRMSMPVIYNSNGEAKPGILRITKTNATTLVVRLQDVHDGFHLYVYSL